VGDARVWLSWADPADDTITGYQYQQQTRTGGSWPAWGATWSAITGSSSSTTSLAVSGLVNGTEYRFRIRAVNASGGSDPSDAVSATPVDGVEGHVPRLKLGTIQTLFAPNTASAGSPAYTHMNDHTVYRDVTGRWHVIGNANNRVPAGTAGENQFAHGVADSLLGPYTRRPDIDPNGSTNWAFAPHAITFNDKAYMFYGPKTFGLVTSSDLVTWTNETLSVTYPALGQITDSTTPRDAMVLEDGGVYYKYVTSVDPSAGNQNVVDVLRSTDLINWAYVGHALTLSGDAPKTTWSTAESPFVVKYSGSYYLFVTVTDTNADNDNYHQTLVFRSDSPTDFGDFNGDKVNPQDAHLVTELPVHAPEVVLDPANNRWYITTTGWETRQLYTQAADGVAIIEMEWITAPANETPISNAGWTLHNASSHHRDHPGSHAFDRDPTTYWESGSGSQPHTLDINLGAVYDMNGLVYVPEPHGDNGGVNGAITTYRLYVSADGTNWGDPAASSGTFDNSIIDNNARKLVTFPTAQGQYIRFESTAAAGGTISRIQDLGILGSSPNPQITTDAFLSAPEGVSEVATLEAMDSDPNASLTWSLAGGADRSLFALTAAGVLSFASAQDFENPGDSDADGVYEVLVSVSNGTDSTTAHLAVTVTNVAELTSISGKAAVTHPENWPGRVATYSASSSADAAMISWRLSGADASHFSIDDPGGALRFSLAPLSGHLFSSPPDYNAPVDGDGDGVYEVTVHAEANGASKSLSVEVTVGDEPEPGTLTLSTTRPALGGTLTATLEDPDGVTGAVSYLWERSVGRGRWEALAGTAATHVAGAADAGRFLRVTATYDDGRTSSNRATAETKEVVTAELLSALSVSTDDSGANPSHVLKPSFDPAVLHYSIGCAADGDTMAITPTAAAGVRLSIDGTQVASGGTRNVAVDDANAEVRITLASASGAATDYFVRCALGDLLNATVETAAGATGVIEDLILIGGCQRIAIIDPNGATRWYISDGARRCGYFRAAWVSAADEYRYLYSSGTVATTKWHVLDENLEELAQIRTVSPLKATDYHDALILDDGNYVLIAYEPAVRDLSGFTFGGLTDDGDFTHTFGASEPVQDSVIQIRTPQGASQFLWNSWDGIPFEDCKPNMPPHSRWVDWAHINTVQMIDGDIVASFRGCNQVLRIDPDMDGAHKVVWRVGLTTLSDEQWEAAGKGPPPLSFVGDEEGQFCGQHGSSLLPGERLLLFDNGVECMPDPYTDVQLVDRTGAYSRAVEYALDHDSGEAVFMRDHSLGGTRSRAGQFHGHAEALENGDWLVSWGSWIPCYSSAGPCPTWPPSSKPNKSITQVDPNTGEELLSITIPGRFNSQRAMPLSPAVLADAAAPLQAAVVDGAHTSTRHDGPSDRPTVAVAFNRPVADFTATSSVSIVGATVESIEPLVEAGLPAHAYRFTLVPTGDAITFSLLADQDCTGSDPAGVCTADGTRLTDVPAAAHTILPYIQPPEFAAASTTRSVAENTAPGAGLGGAVAASSTHLYTLTYSKSGADADAFTLDEATGQLSTLASLDYEDKPTYRFTLSVTDGINRSGDTDDSTDDSIAVTISVTDVDEPGAVSLSTLLPRAGTALSASLADDDGPSGVSWQWQRLSTGWGDIAGAVGASYTPVDDDVGHALRVVASYVDGSFGAERVTSSATQATRDRAPVNNPIGGPGPPPGPIIPDDTDPDDDETGGNGDDTDTDVEFADVPESNPHTASIDALRAAGITQGCSQEPPRYCPNRPVTRAEMATFLTRALNLTTPNNGAGFADVPESNPHTASIDALRAAGITAGCSQQPLRYCPNRPVTRAEMATFLTRALNLT